MNPNIGPINELATALSKAQAAIRSAPKDSKGFNYKYTDLAGVWEVLRGPLTSNGLSVLQMPSTDGKKVTVVTLLMHASGQYMAWELSVEAKSPIAQDVGSAITYCRRYALLGIGVSSEDDDGAAATHGHMPNKKEEQIPPFVVEPGGRSSPRMEAFF